MLYAHNIDECQDLLMKSMNKSIKTPKTVRFSEYVPGGSLKDYWHFDKEFTSNNPSKLKKVSDYILSPEEVAKHAFFPLISATLKERKISRKLKFDYYQEVLKNNPNDESVKSVCTDYINDFKENGVNKVRTVTYASHIDSHIYKRYYCLLKDAYERKIKNTRLNDEVIAYRDLTGTKRNGVAINFSNLIAAYDAVLEIKKRDNKCYALCFDISHFFDSIDHKILKEQWAAILGCDSLPADHYNIYKSLTKFSYVDRQDIKEYVKGVSKILKATASPHKIFSNAKDFRKFRKITGKIKKNPGLSKEGVSPHGIPQGVCISSVLSNIYFLPFDKSISDYIHGINGFYRRFCDDILIIIPNDPKLKENCISFIKQRISELGEALKIHPINEWDRYSKSQCYDFSDEISSSRNPFEYLGISFDGKNVRVRQSSVSRYQKKVIKAVNAFLIKKKQILWTEFLKKRTVRVFRKKQIRIDRKALYNYYTFNGSRNFVSYVNAIAKLFESEAVKKQLKSHCSRLSRLIEIANNKLRKDVFSFLKLEREIKKMISKEIVYTHRVVSKSDKSKQ